MPKYVYTAKREPHKTIKAEIEAESEQDAINRLNKTGYFPISINPVAEFSKTRGSANNIIQFKKIPLKEITLFTRQLALLLESGVNIINGLNILSSQTANIYFKLILTDITERIKSGKSIAESLTVHNNIFSSFYTSMVHSGETGGNIEQALNRLADFMEKQEELKNTIRAALTYPFFILTVSVITIGLLLGFVIPRLVSMFEDMGQILPLPTKIIINFSSFLRSYWWIIAAGACICVFLFRRLQNKPQGRINIDKIKFKTPIIGKIILKKEISSLMRTLSLLLTCGIPIVYALEVANATVQNLILKLEVQDFIAKIASGASFSECLKNSKLFPVFITSIITVGEETGNIEKSLIRIADEYDKDIDRSLKALIQLLEPIIILGMGIFVGFIVLSMLLPIFQIDLLVK